MKIEAFKAIWTPTAKINYVELNVQFEQYHKKKVQNLLSSIKPCIQRPNFIQNVKKKKKKTYPNNCISITP